MEGEEKPMSGSNSKLDERSPQSTENESSAVEPVGSRSEGMNEIPCSEKTTKSNNKLTEKDTRQMSLCTNERGTSNTEEVQLPEESHPGEGHGVKNEPPVANGELNVYIKRDIMKPDNTPGLPDHAEEVDKIGNIDSKDKFQPEERGEVPQNDNFVQGIMGCLDELRRLDDKEADRVKPNEDDGKEMGELPNCTSTALGKTGENLCCSEYFEPSLFEVKITMPYGANGVSGLDELNYEADLQNGVQKFPALNDSYANQSHLKPEINDGHEKLVVNGTARIPVGNIEHTSSMNIDIGASQTKFITSIPSSFQEYYGDTNIKLPIPENLREHRWLFANALAFKLGTSGFSYIGGIADGKMQGFGRMMLGDSGQFMEGIWKMNRLVELHSSQLICDPGNQMVLILRRQKDHLLTMFESNYVARVIFDKIEELDFADCVALFKRDFFKKLIVVQLMADELEDKKRASLDKFATLLAKTIGVDANPIVRANNFIILSLYLRKPDTDLLDIFRDRKIPVDVRDAAADLLDCENRYLSNTYIFSNNVAKLRLDLRRVLAKIYNDGISMYRQILIDKCPRALPKLSSYIQTLPESKMVYITCEDMRVFDHLVSQPCFEHYTTFFENLVERFNHAIHNIETHTAPSTVIPVISPVYGFIVKSFWEIITEIIQIVNCYEYKDMLYCESGNWKLQKKIKWPEREASDTHKQEVQKFFKSAEKKSLLYHSSLEIQYNVIYKMMKYFSPENYIVKRKYDYNFRVLEEDLSWWEKGLKIVKQKVGLAKRLENLTTERVVWLCLLDHTIHEVFKDEPQYEILLKPYNSLLQGQISFIEKSLTESHETFRTMTHSVLKFIMSTAPYFREARDKPGIDIEILVQQIWTFSSASQEMKEDPTTVSKFRDLISEYNRYLSLRLFINIESTSGFFSPKITQMMHTFMRIVVTSLKKTVPTTTLVGYLRSLNDFLDNFKNLGFLANWFVKSKFSDPDILEKVYNKLSAGGNCSYRVLDPEKFVQVVQILGNQPIPHHYIIQVVSILLECIEICLNKQWESGNVELQVTQLECTSLLLNAVRKSFLYLKEQPDYVDFESFEKESVDPFVRLVNDSITLSDLKKRTAKVGESYWHVRKIDEIGIDRALKMFKNINTCDVSNKLLDCYNVYLSCYNELIAKYSSLLSDGKSHAEGVDGLVQVLDETNPVHFSMWTEEFKTEKIPVLLARLSAVWSILMSKDISSSGKFLKPHCIQILCVLRLLSVDQFKGADNHLAQVLTGQGKSIILGLLSSILALTGHKVKVLCYSNYLCTRDKNDFEEFFRIFHVIDKIEYGTFKDMANSFLNPVSNGTLTNLRKLVEERVLNHTDRFATGSVTTISKDTVLLIDEVDVFFTDRFYGNSYYPVTTLEFEGLAKVQEKIWSVAKSDECNSAEEIAQLLNQYIADEAATGNEALLEFNAFLNKPGVFNLLIYENGYLAAKTYTNRSLYDEHLLEMASDALRVRYYDWAQSGYIMSDEEIVCRRKVDGTYSQFSYCGYRNVFNYFRLKGSNYDSKNLQNYGYMNLRAGIISYAQIPSLFQLILGVSGTLTNLGDYEKAGIKFYNINNFSILPSFFGECNLLFNKDADFHYFNKEQDWLKDIYDRANEIVESRRAVLIFFDLDTTINVFTEEYKTKFDRMNELTENTCASIRDSFIDEAGLPCTVTLATRGMGRGVDYKSSLSVEKNGGVHVIQTFYSLDVKEEVQIKGRTARKDNKGSYELIICKEHLVKDKVIPQDDDTAHNYASLDKIRKDLCVKKGETVHAKIEERERDHTTTMKYFGLM